MATAEAAKPVKGSKKMIVIIAVVALVLVIGGLGAVLLLKKKSADAESEGDGAGSAQHASASHKTSAVPVFVPLDPFTVNLADRDAERYAQVAVTLEIDDAHVGDQIKAYMPAIRNNVLMAIADRTASELLAREGKTRLAEKIRREACRALGYEVDDDEEDADTGEQVRSTKSKKRRRSQPELPVKAVHFSNFIVQ